METLRSLLFTSIPEKVPPLDAASAKILADLEERLTALDLLAPVGRRDGRAAPTRADRDDDSKKQVAKVNNQHNDDDGDGYDGDGNGGVVWASGIGYGHGGNADKWHLSQLAAQQKKEADALVDVLSKLKKPLEAAQRSANPFLHRKVCRRLGKSKFMPFLLYMFADHPTSQVMEQVELYEMVMNVTTQLLDATYTACFLAAPVVPKRDKTILAIAFKALIDRLTGLYNQEMRALGKLNLESDGRPQLISKLETGYALMDDKLRKCLATADYDHIKMCMELMSEAKNDGAKSATGSLHPETVAKMQADADVTVEENAAVAVEDGEVVEVKTAPNIEAEYVKRMADLRVDEVSDFPKHQFKSQAAEAVSRQYVRRLMTEYADLRQSLPLCSESSVFVRFNPEDLHFAQMLITAPYDTPYGGGCFLFDLYLPSNYPNVPPKCNLQTTGHGSVRFNPNLYDSGYVCLSLLGTWSGQASESWDPKTSTLLQLAVSIQSLIFVPQPYYNEPGLEQSRDDESSDSYNENIEQATVQWAMIDMMKTPPAGFEEVVRNHFQMSRNKIMAQVDKWKAQPNRSRLENLLPQLEAAFKSI